MSGDDFILALEQRIALAMQHFQVPGVAVGIRRGDEETLTGVGITSVENPLRVTPDTLFQIGSITKTMTGSLAMMLVDEGKLDLDAPVQRYLPTLRLSDERVAAQVTARQLLTHRGGWVGDFFKDTGRGGGALERMVEELAALPQLTPPGEHYSYNNAGYYILGRVIEVITGTPFERALQERLFEPLGMDHSFLLPEDVMTRRFVVGHETIGYPSPQVARPWALARNANAVGGVASTVRDLLRYARLHLRSGTADNGARLISEESARQMHTAQAAADNDRQVGLAFFLTEVGGRQVVMHGGATKGQMAQLQLIPGHDFALAMLTNSDRGDELYNEIGAWILRERLGLESPQDVPIDVDDATLDEYVGRYNGAYSTDDVILTRREGQLVLELIPKGGFPDVDMPPPPAPPPVRAALYAPDRLIPLEEPLNNSRGEFIRDRAGKIEWLRFQGRLCRRQ